MKRPNWFKRKWIWFKLLLCRIFYAKDDRKYLLAVYKIRFGKKANLDNPQTFNEKLMWLKLYWRDERCYRLVDKYEVKEYVKECGLEHILLKNYGVYDTFDELYDKIEFEGKKLVIKTTHDCGGVWIVNCKEELQSIRKEIIKKMKRTYNHAREWVYYKVKPRIIVEEFIPHGDNCDLLDYKFYCFNGKVKIILVCSDRKNSLKLNFYDINWNPIPCTHGHPRADKNIIAPNNFKEMINISEKLAADFNFARIDLYSVKDSIFFGEITFFPGGGNIPFSPEEFEIEFGRLLDISNIENKKEKK